MATFLLEGREIYYEDHGAGKPLLVLNGIFMSCASWEKFVPAFSKTCRLLLLDFYDQGRTAKREADYTQEEQVKVVDAFLRHMGLLSCSIIGISYGGEVAMQFASAYPDKVDKLILSNTAANTSDWLRDIGHSWEYACNSHDGKQFFKTCIPIVYSPQFYVKNYAWASAREALFERVFTPAIYDAFSRLIRSAETHDVRQALHKITAETLVISAEHDFVTPLYQQKEIVAGIPNAAHATIVDAGHAVMYEKPAEFISLVLGFVNSDTDVTLV